MPDDVTAGQDQGGQQQESAPPVSNPLYPTGRLHSTIKDDVDPSSMSFTQDSKPAAKETSSDGTDPGTAKNIQGESGTAKGGEGDKGTPGTTDGKPKAYEQVSEERFDKNPMFQRLNRSNQKLKDEVTRLSTMVETMLKVKGEGGGKEDGGESDTNILDMEDGDLREQFDTNPKKFLADYGRQLFREFQERFDEGRKTTDFQSAQRKELETYSNDNPDFVERWESGEIPDYMRKHPGNTAISAHMRLTEKTRIQAVVDKAVNEAIAKTRSEERRNAGARMQGSTVLPTTTGVPGESSAADAILKDTSKAGGRTNAILQILRMRKSS